MNPTRKTPKEPLPNGGLQPETDHDWTIHALNIHGTFFERWCRSAVERTNGWKVVRVGYPVEFPPTNGPFRGNQSTLDILAEHATGETLVALPIECKKNNADLSRWVFFQKGSVPGFSGVNVLQTAPREGPGPRWTTNTGRGGIKWPFPVTDDGREVRGTYVGYKKGDKTKTSNDAISGACHQVALATQSIFLDEAQHSDALASHPTAPTPYKTKVLVPTVVTSATLGLCTFSPADVDGTTGEIPLDRATIDPVDALVYEYPLPRDLQNKPVSLASVLLERSLESFSRMHVLVVHSAVLPIFLQLVAKVSEAFQAISFDPGVVG